jgi:hypothetical protein
MLSTPFFAALGAAAWSKLYAKHPTRTALVYFVAVYLALWLLLMLSPKTRTRDEQKSVDGFSVTGSGSP